GRRLLAWAHEAGFTDVTPSATVWCFATPDDREYWGGMWSERVVASSFAAQAVESGLSTRDDLERMSRAVGEWRGAAASLVPRPPRRDPLPRLTRAQEGRRPWVDSVRVNALPDQV